MENTIFSAPWLVLDGATGTELQKAGKPSKVCSEQWCLEHPEAVIALQQGYAEAGSQAVYAPTFSANRASLAPYGKADCVRELNLRVVELSRRAVQGKCLVAGDLSPSGLMPEPFGTSSEEEIFSVFREQAAALEEAGVDYFGVETQMSLMEALLTVKAVRDVSKRPVAVSFTVGPTGKTLWGDELTDAVKALEPLGIDAFGINCCGDLALLREKIAELHAVTALPLIAKPNAGKPQMENGETVYRMTPEELAAEIPALYAAGARLLGGCCGTHRGHIAAIRSLLETL